MSEMTEKNAGRDALETIQVSLEMVPREREIVHDLISGRTTVQSYISELYADAIEFLTGESVEGLPEEPARYDAEKEAGRRRDLKAKPKLSGPPSRQDKTTMSGHLRRLPILEANGIAARMDLRHSHLPAIGLALKFAEAGLPFPQTSEAAVRRLSRMKPEKAEELRAMFA